MSKRSEKLKLLPYYPLKFKPRYKPETVKVEGKKFKIADSASFYYSYREIFIDKIYKFNSKSSAPVILDLGSNYGTSIVYFKSLFPGAKITGVEADPKIYELLKWNIQQHNYKDVEVINKAVSTSGEPLNFLSEGSDAGRITDEKGSQNTILIDPIDMDDLIQGPIDFLKMDIEGAESDVICASKNLSQVSQMFIEYHSYKNDTQRLNEILSKLTSEGFRYYIHTQFCSDKPFTEEKLQVGMDLQLNIFVKR